MNMKIAKPIIVVGLALLALFFTYSIYTRGLDQQQIDGLMDQNSQLEAQVVRLETEKAELQAEISAFSEPLNIDYVDYGFSQRFVQQATTLVALPTEGAAVMRDISPNTVVKVFDAAYSTEQLWLYVSMPVYDTPSNFKGWVLESDTVPLTKENVSQVQSDVTVPAGTVIYEVYFSEDISSSTATKLAYEQRGRIEEKKNGYARIFCPGGMTIWVKETDIVYPEIY